MVTYSQEKEHAAPSGGAEEFLTALLDRAYDDGDRTALETVQNRLAALHAKSFEIPQEHTGFKGLGDDLDEALRIEERMLAHEDRFIDLEGFEGAEDGGQEFVRRLKKVVREHPANRHPFYLTYLPEQASVADIAFYLAQESALDPRFDDFIALMQIGMPVGPKLELAANYWDEMGNGAFPRVHTVMFQDALDEVGATPEYIASHQIVEATVCGNLSALFALRRPLIHRAIGSFAVTEFLFPRRCSQLLEAWERNGLSAKGHEYHREHVGVDARHASGFFKNVITPLVDASPAVAGEVYRGALARLNSSQRYLDRILTRLTDGTERGEK
ncbi:MULTISPECIES: iron-containing redox enzyme family protein [Streptomyces]|uniref:Iron-containing redox enzyme family protein n=1 Tax=Streptomyces ramulosus TaxID=47762 RepID=A0ABW1FRS8_9ACTN